MQSIPRERKKDLRFRRKQWKAQLEIERVGKMGTISKRRKGIQDGRGSGGA